MAPRKNVAAAAAPPTPFYDDDMISIKEDLECEASENKEADVMIDEHCIRSRRYKYVKGAWVYLGVFNVDKDELVEAPEQQPKKAAKPRAPKKEAVVAAVAVKTSDDEEEKVVADAAVVEKKERKPRAQVTLTSVMEALEANKIEEGKKLLLKFIEKNGTDGKRKRRDPNAPVVEKKRSAYQQFLSDEMKRIALEDVDKPVKMPQTERMKAALAAWRAKKEADAVVAKN